MNRIIGLVCTVLLGLILPGCGSKFPIADVSQAVIDDRLVGRWGMSGNKEGETAEISFLKFNDREYYVQLRTEESDPENIEHDTLHARVYVIQIEDQKIINAQLIGSNDPAERLYYFYNYFILEDTMLIYRGLTNIDSVYINNFNSSEELYIFIQTNLNNEALFEEPDTLTKIKNHF